MYRAGQFLVEPSAFFGWLNPLGFIAVGVMLFTLGKLRENYLTRLAPRFTPEMYGVGLGVGAVLSIVSTLVLTSTSLIFFEVVVEWTGADVDPKRMQASRVEENHTTETESQLGSGQTKLAANLVNNVAGNKFGQVAIVVGITLLVIGAGYTFTALNLGFLGTFAGMSAGVGLPEELAKAAAGMFVLYVMFDTKSLSESQFRRAILVSFGIAGLGFGAGEALKYFGEYAREDAGVVWYGVRAVWCVPLHGAWTLIVGAILTSFLPQDPGSFETKKAETFYTLLVASIPTAIAHGLYNACCVHGSILPWVVGGISIFVAMVAIESFLEEQIQAVERSL